MDYRCPLCRKHPGKRKLIDAVVARMEMECPHCRSTIRLNVHRAETAIVLFNFAMIVALGAIAWWFPREGLVLLVLGAVLAGTAVLPLLERTWLRAWPRYVPADKAPRP
jgi:hypothetical protein